MTATERISVLLAGDDSAATRALRTALEADGDISVVAVGALDAGARRIRTLEPDLIALQMPASSLEAEKSMTAIREVMRNRPTPILVLTPQGATWSPDAAIAAGALQAMPQARTWEGEPGTSLRQLARRLSHVVVVRRGRVGTVGVPARSRIPVIGIAASTGGPQAVARVLGELGGLEAAVMVVQHIHEDFVDGLVTLMQRASALPVELAEQGQVLRAGVVHLAPGHRHLQLGPGGRVVLTTDPPSLHRPSADVLFRSIAANAGRHGIGVVLTGMGEDGAAGLLALREQGGIVIAQDEASCAVFGMPRAAGLIGAVHHVVPLDRVAATIRRSVEAARR